MTPKEQATNLVINAIVDKAMRLHELPRDNHDILIRMIEAALVSRELTGAKLGAQAFREQSASFCEETAQEYDEKHPYNRGYRHGLQHAQSAIESFDPDFVAEEAVRGDEKEGESMTRDLAREEKKALKIASLEGAKLGARAVMLQWLRATMGKIPDGTEIDPDLIAEEAVREAEKEKL